jgi:hypothetical protein
VIVGRRGVELRVDEARLEELINRLRQELHVYDVEAVTSARLPE